MKEKEELYQKLLKKYGKVLTNTYISFTIIENDIETAKKMLEDSYKEECEYNERRKGSGINMYYNPIKEGLDEIRFKVGDIVYFMKLKGKIVKIKYNSYLGIVCLVKYSFFDKKWCFQSSLTPNCECCKKHKSMDCPNSFLCFSKDNKPFYESNN